MTLKKKKEKLVRASGGKVNEFQRLVRWSIMHMWPSIEQPCDGVHARLKRKRRRAHKTCSHSCLQECQGSVTVLF